MAIKPGAGHSERYGSDKGHRIGMGPRTGDAGGTAGAGTKEQGRRGGGNNNGGRKNGGRDPDENRK